MKPLSGVCLECGGPLDKYNVCDCKPSKKLQFKVDIDKDRWCKVHQCWEPECRQFKCRGCKYVY